MASNAVDETKELIEKGFKGIHDEQEKARQAAEAEFDVLKKRLEAVEGIPGELKKTEKWVSEVEAKVNTARTHGPAQDNLVAAIAPEYRRHIDIATRHGYPDPVMTTSMCLWWSLQFKARLALRMVTGHTPGEYLEQANNIEKAWGFDPVLKDILNEGAGGGGSNIIATPVEAMLWRLIRDNTIVRPLATKIIMAGPSMVIPTENANVTAFLVAEGVTISDSIASTAFAPQTLVAKKFAGLATVSNELLADNIIGLNEYLFQAIAEGIGILEDRGALDGTNFTGIRVATGVNSQTANGTGVTNGTTPTYTEMMGVIYGALQAASREQGRFFMHPGSFKNLAGAVDTTGQPLISFGNVSGAFAQFYAGYPVSLVSSLGTSWLFATTSSNIYFGPPSKILFGDISGMSFDIDPYSLLDKVQTRIRVLKRTGILVPVGAYFTVLNGVKAK